jgi:hypothetical protein
MINQYLSTLLASLNQSLWITMAFAPPWLQHDGLLHIDQPATSQIVTMIHRTITILPESLLMIRPIRIFFLSWPFTSSVN